MQENDVKVSVITIVYNAGTVIEKTVQSVINQIYPNIEYIIVDGNSNDNTLEQIEKYKSKISVLISEPDKGISDAFNKGIRHATGEIIIFLNAGDVFCNERVIENAVRKWKEKPLDVLFYKVQVGKKTYIPDESYGNNEEKIWNACQVPHQGAFVKKEVFEKIGYFNPLIKIRMDFEFFARCKKYGCSYCYIPEVIVFYEEGGASMRKENAKLFYQEGIAIKLLYGMKVGIMDYIYFTMPMWLRTIGKKMIKR